SRPRSRAMPFAHPVIVFDLDGTLIRNTTVSLLLAEGVGRLPAVEELERLYDSYAIDNDTFSDREAALLAGLTPEQIRGFLADAPWTAGVEETLRTLTEGGCTLLLATLAWGFAVEELEHRPWFSAVGAADMEYVDGALSGRVDRYFDEQGKLDFVRAWCAERGVPLDQVAAVGDSRSDLRLFAGVGTSVALNASADARAAADHVLDTEDLRDLLPLLRTRTA
ncbi:HAD family hydrolase, partial [Streptomyces clavuligerus]